jgi:ferritin-like metal-binding protein YciE
MPMTVSNRRDLFLTVLSDLLFVERQQAFEVLPELLKEVSDPELTHALAEHLQETKRHARELEDVFREAGAEPSSDHSFAFGGMQEQRSSRVSSIVAISLKDLFNATAAAHIEHYEIAAYQTLIPLSASIIGDDGLAVLRRNLGEERQALAQLEQAIERLASPPERPAGQ